MLDICSWASVPPELYQRTSGFPNISVIRELLQNKQSNTFYSYLELIDLRFIPTTKYIIVAKLSRSNYSNNSRTNVKNCYLSTQFPMQLTMQHHPVVKLPNHLREYTNPSWPRCLTETPIRFNLPNMETK